MLTIANETKSTIPKIQFQKIKKLALGDDYELCLIFISPSQITKLNKKYRNKDSPTDILSFGYSDKQGEIYICPTIARVKAKSFARIYSNFLAFLFIHGCTHLKGYSHGCTMELIETSLRKKLSI